MSKHYLLIIPLLLVLVIVGYFAFRTLQNSEIIINDKGELIEIRGREEITLVSVEHDMQSINVPEGIDALEGATLYIKGQVKSFDISPDEKYVAYTTLEGFVSCCGGTNNVTLDKVWVMELEGKNKSIVETPPITELEGRQLIRYKEWYPDSSGIMVYFQFPDESMQGSGIYKIGVDGKNPILDPSKKLPFEE